MRVAVVSDIHGNLLALDAVMSDIEDQDVDEVWCGGDLAWGGAWGAECIERVRGARWPTVKGNTDVWITGDPQTAATAEDRRFVEEMAAAHALSNDDAQWLLGLPLGHTGSGSLLLVHGTPESPFEGPEPDAPASAFGAYQGAATIVVCGHIHRAYTRRLSDGTIVCNAGSVGLPMDDDTACYLIIDRDGPDWVLRHRRVAYDRRAVIAQLKRTAEPIRSWTLRKLGEE